VLFGAYDTSRFDGPMTVVPLLPEPEESSQMRHMRALLMTLSITDSNGHRTRIMFPSSGVNARFDSGKPISLQQYDSSTADPTTQATPPPNSPNPF